MTPSAMSHSLAELRDAPRRSAARALRARMVLTPRAEALVGPLHKLLVDAERLLGGGTAFDPAHGRAALRHRGAGFPRDACSSRRSSRRPRAKRRASRSRSCRARGAATPGSSRPATSTSRSARSSTRRRASAAWTCAPRASRARRGKGHPTIDGALDLDTYVKTPHLRHHARRRRGPDLDRSGARQARDRSVTSRSRTRYFMSAPLVIARSDLLLTGPSMLIRYFAELVPLQVLAPPIELPTYPEEAYWHERFDDDPAHAGCATS